MTDPAANRDVQSPVPEPPSIGSAQRRLYRTLSRAMVRVTRLHRLDLRQAERSTHSPPESRNDHD